MRRRTFLGRLALTLGALHPRAAVHAAPRWWLPPQAEPAVVPRDLSRSLDPKASRPHAAAPWPDFGVIFQDGFESADTSRWEVAAPKPGGAA